MNNIHPEKSVTDLSVSDLPGPVLVLAPHADDESLGCGGVIAALREHNLPVHVWLISDGTMSHPNSLDYPADRREALREAEFRQACLQLGVPNDNLLCFRLPDTQVPLPGAPGFREAVAQLAEPFRELNPGTIFTPWRRDPHCDHQATTALIRAVVSQTVWPGTLYEYPIWLYELATKGDAPHPGEVEVLTFQLTEELLQKKEKAIKNHATQLGQIIHDDPTAFFLHPEVLAHFLTPTEYYYHAHEK